MIVYKTTFYEGWDDDSDHTKSLHKTEQGARDALAKIIMAAHSDHRRRDHMDWFHEQCQWGVIPEELKE